MAVLCVFLVPAATENPCAYCCVSRCKSARSFDSRCAWDYETESCFRCWRDGAVDNGMPANPGAPVILTAQQLDRYGLGDSFTVRGNYNTNAELITGMTLWLAE